MTPFCPFFEMKPGWGKKKEMTKYTKQHAIFFSFFLHLNFPSFFLLFPFCLIIYCKLLKVGTFRKKSCHNFGLTIYSNCSIAESITIRDIDAFGLPTHFYFIRTNKRLTNQKLVYERHRCVLLGGETQEVALFCHDSCPLE